jgi:uncharacterized membrane protein
MRARTNRNLVGLGGGLGLIAAIYSALELYYSSLTKVCSINSKISCGAVLASGKTTTLGVSDAFWGIGGFLAILVLAILLDRNRKDERLAYLLFAVTTAGVLLALYFLYIEVAVIGALCPVCVSAYFFGGLAWIGAMGLARRAYRRAHATPEPVAAKA